MTSEEMRDKKKTATTSEITMDSVQLIASVLYCFPELAKVKLEEETSSVILGFCVNTEPAEELLAKAKQTIYDGLAVYHLLDKDGDWAFNFYYHEMVVYIVRDIGSMSRQEINLIVTMMRDVMGSILEIDDNSGADEDIISTQTDMIDHRLVFLRENRVRHNMQGVREDGRVMIFDKNN